MNVENVIKKRASSYVDSVTTRNFLSLPIQKATEMLDDSLYEITKDLDKYSYLTTIKKSLELKHKDHISHCTNPSCPAEDNMNDFLYNLQNRIDEVNQYQDSLSIEEQSVLNIYLDNLDGRINKLVDVDQASLSLIQDLKNELDELRKDFQILTKRQAGKQFRGTLWEISKVLFKAGLHSDEITEIVSEGLDNPASIFQGELGFQSLKLIGSLL